MTPDELDSYSYLWEPALARLKWKTIEVEVDEERDERTRTERVIVNRDGTRLISEDDLTVGLLRELAMISLKAEFFDRHTKAQ